MMMMVMIYDSITNRPLTAI